MPMPKQSPGSSNQDRATPWELIRAVERRFGKITIDLAADAKNHKADKWIALPNDSLALDWSKLIGNGIGWLNPPFAKIKPWAEKCAFHGRGGTRILLLVPYSIAEWSDVCASNARRIGLRPRMSFGVRNKNRPERFDPYPKDLRLYAFGDWGKLFPNPLGSEIWNWQIDAKKEGSVVCLP